MNLVPIRELVLGVNSWNPRKEARNRTIQYIDLSAVDSERKEIDSVQSIPGDEAPSRARQLVQSGDILLSTVRPNLNGVARVPIKLDGATASTGFCILRPDPRRLCVEYLFHWLRTPAFVSDMVRKATGASYPAVSDRIVFESTIPLPSLPEQRRIAAILDQVDALRRKRRDAIKRVESLASVAFRQLISSQTKHETIELSELVEFQEGPGIRNWQFRDTGVKLINVKNIVDGRLDISNTSRYLDPSEVRQRYSHFLLNAGDLVMASSGVTWGKIAEVRKSDLPLCLNTSMIRLVPRAPTIEKSFIRAFVEFGNFRTQIERLITGSAQPNFGPSHLRKVKMPIVDLDWQRHFAASISQVERQKGLYASQLAKLNVLFESLQTTIFAAKQPDGTTTVLKPVPQLFAMT